MIIIIIVKICSENWRVELLIAEAEINANFSVPGKAGNQAVAGSDVASRLTFECPRSSRKRRGNCEQCALIDIIWFCELSAPKNRECENLLASESFESNKIKFN